MNLPERFEEIVDFDIDELLDAAEKSSIMTGFTKLDRSLFANDDIKGSVVYDLDKVFFAIAYVEPTNSVVELSTAERLTADIWKNCMIDEAYNLLRSKIEIELIKKNLHLSVLYGPGYYEMPLSDIKLVCEKAKAHKIGIKPHADGHMEPTFSRCGFFVILDSEELEKDLYCDSCHGSKLGCSLCHVFSTNI